MVFRRERRCLADFRGIKSVSMDMSRAYIKAVKDRFERREEIICFDRFHIAQLLNKAAGPGKARGIRGVEEER